MSVSIIVRDSSIQRGRKDAKRHRDKQKDAHKKRLPEIFTNETIITGDPKKPVKFPIRGVALPHFRPARTGVGAGIGQGQGKPGDVLRPSTGPGENELDTETTLEELIEWAMEDIGLPRFDEKEVKELLAVVGYRLKGIQKTGPMSLLDHGRTGKEGFKRFWAYLKGLEAETGLDRVICFRALKQAGGNPQLALDLIKNSQVTNTDDFSPFPILVPDQDFRFHGIEEDIQPQSQAVVVLMMDVSSSMDRMKKYLVRMLAFWLVGFLRRLYKNVEVRFIVHHTEARLVDELTFFNTKASGGTYCWTAYDLAYDLLETEYSYSAWNRYVWHFSDGEDSDPQKTVIGVNKFLDKINMMGYGEVDPSEIEKANPLFNESDLWKVLRIELGLKESFDQKELIIMTRADVPFLGVKIENKNQILPAIKSFLTKDRWVK